MVDEIRLYKNKLVFQSHVPCEMIDEKLQLRSDLNEDWCRNLLRAHLTGFLWGELGSTQTIKYPRTWWSAFKERWFPLWLLRRFPVEYIVYEINLTTLYPFYKPSLLNEASVLKWTTSSRVEKG